MSAPTTGGPLIGIRVIELAGIGPAPHAGMILADLGADVVRIDRPTPGAFGGWAETRFDVLGRGRRSIALDLKNPAGVEVALRMVERADALIEGFRPGVVERLGLGPEVCMARNARLVYGRMTGWGQQGPLAHVAGHDITYVALTGALHAIGSAAGPPVVPLNLVGDFGGGSLYLVVGVLAGLLETSRSGQGQVVDAAMVDGATSLLAAVYGAAAHGFWQDRREANLLDGGAPFYGVYETSDGKYVAIGAIEPQFYAELLRRTGLADEPLPGQFDSSGWPRLRERLAQLFQSKTRQEWCTLLEGSDACFAPVLSLAEAPQHEHVRARRTFVEIEGVTQPGPAPRFERTPGRIRSGPPVPGQDFEALLTEIGYSNDQITALVAEGAVVPPGR